MAKTRNSKSREYKRDNSPKEQGQQAKGFNDPSWYAKNPQLLKDAASLAFANFQGIKIHDTGTTGGEDFSPASIMAIDYIPTFGKATSATDAINIAVRNIYSFVRHANSGHTNYEPADLGIYLFAVTELYGMIAHLEHIYGISRVYSVKNRALPTLLLKALGMNPDDVLANQATFRFNINRLIQKLSSLCIPAGMSLLQRRIWMNSFTFKDADTDKSSLYVFNPRGYYKFEATALPSGGCLAFNNWGPNDSTTSASNGIIYSIEKAIDAVLEDEDMNIMSGDILKAYGEGNLAKLGYLPEDYFSIPVYQPEVLPQIHNLVLPGLDETRYHIRSAHLQYGGSMIDYSSITSDIVLQQSGGILYNELYVGDAPTSTMPKGTVINGTIKDIPMSMMIFGKSLLDLPKDAVEPADVMVATRLKPSFKSSFVVISGDTFEIVDIDQFGTEIPVSIGVWFAGTTSSTPDSKIDSSVVGPYLQSGSLIDTRTSDAALAITQFNMAPLFYYTSRYNANPGTDNFPFGNFSFTYVLGDIYNYTAITDATLTKLHTTAVLSEVSIGALFGDK